MYFISTGCCICICVITNSSITYYLKHNYIFSPKWWNTQNNLIHTKYTPLARRQLHKNAASNLEQVLATTPHKTPTVRPPASYHENYSS